MVNEGQGRIRAIFGPSSVSLHFDFPSAEFHEESFGNKLHLLLKDQHNFAQNIDTYFCTIDG
jgi:hypothetical protein